MITDHPQLLFHREVKVLLAAFVPPVSRIISSAGNEALLKQPELLMLLKKMWSWQLSVRAVPLSDHPEGAPWCGGSRVFTV